jgi:DnaJ-class molecular chaperone
MSKNLYEILGVDKSSNPDVIKKAYRKLSFKHHPDRGGDSQKMKEINDAYQILGDGEKKQMYDMQRNSPFGGMNGMAGMAGMNPMEMQGDILRMFFGGEGGSPFGMGNSNMRFFHNGRPVNFASMKKPTPIIKTIQITLKQAFSGIDYPLEIERWIQEGDTKKVEKEKIYFNIKAGIDNNEIIIIKEKGNIVNENAKGDIKIFVKIKNESSFQRKGLDLIHNQKITLKESLTGFAFELKHLSGKTYVINNSDGKIIQPGYHKIINYMGMSRERGHPAPPLKGNLIIKFEIKFPQDISEETREKLKELL